jgi:DNA-binding beta-propeller fold protein YncE
MKTIARAACAFLVSIAFVAASAAEGGLLYRIESAQTIKSATLPNWDYLAFDSAHGILYIARREDGILVYDTKAKKLRGAIANSQGGNAVIIVPEYQRGFAITEEGEAIVFDLGTRKTLKRVKFGDDADIGTYDPVTRQVVIARGDSGQVTFLDAKTGAVTAHLLIDSKKIESPASDGSGHIFVALRDKNKLVRIDAREHKVVAEHEIGSSCEQPAGMAFDAKTQRLFIGCRGVNPVLAAVDAATGRVVATMPIGRGNDDVVFDAEQRRIYTSNGADANMVMIEQVDPDHYRIAEVTNTRPNARTMALDPKNKTVYLVAAEGAVDGNKPWNKGAVPFPPNTYFKDTFTLLTLSRK